MAPALILRKQPGTYDRVSNGLEGAKIEATELDHQK